MSLENKKILIIGGNGLLGQPIQKILSDSNIPYWAPRSSEMNVLHKEYMEGVFNCYRPDIVFNLFVSYGGIRKNAEKPGSIFYDNLMGNVNVVEACRKFKVEKLVQIGTQCSYADKLDTPFLESRLWDGYPTANNAPYGVAKRIIHTMLEGYKQEFNLNSIYLIPSNMYGGIGENWHPEHSHVIPSLIRRFVEAKESDKPNVEVWGSGKSTREFLYNFDAARAVLAAATNYNSTEPVNIGSGESITIQQLANIIAELVGYKGGIIYNNNGLDGQAARLNSIERAKEAFGFYPATNIKQGLKETIDYFIENRDNLRQVEIY